MLVSGLCSTHPVPGPPRRRCFARLAALGGHHRLRGRGHARLHCAARRRFTKFWAAPASRRHRSYRSLDVRQKIKNPASCPHDRDTFWSSERVARAANKSASCSWPTYAVRVNSGSRSARPRKQFEQPGPRSIGSEPADRQQHRKRHPTSQPDCSSVYIFLSPGASLGSSPLSFRVSSGYRHRGRADKFRSARSPSWRSLGLVARPEKIDGPMFAWLVDGDNPLERAGRRLDSRRRKGSFAMMWFYCLMVALGTAEKVRRKQPIG